MDIQIDRDGTAIGSLFQQIIGDMKNTSPLWEDFIAKATKLHMCLRAAIQAIAAYLDAFQKIADAATNSKGASKEIGTALTRVCLRHKAVETRMKTFTSAIMDFLIIPLQEKLEDWRRQCAILDKEHAKEYKRCRTELKKRSSDTLRLQKKARKGQSDTIQSLVDSSMQDVTQRRADLEEVERKSLRAAMVEERTRFCTFVGMLQPVVKEEIEVMSEMGHLQEAMDSIAIVSKDPNQLPQSSEELILESKTTLSLYPESPGGSISGGGGCSNSLGSRKSSVCSISSMNSSGSSGSPGHQYQRSLSHLLPPTLRLKPGESSDSGFCSSPALTSQASTTTNATHAVSTWPPHTQDVVSTSDRPHTISSAYEKGHQRPALTVYTFQSPENQCDSTSQKSPATMPCRPPLPIRCSSLERPLSTTTTATTTTTSRNTPSQIPRQCPSPIPAHITKEYPQLQPTYVNMSELASMAALKITNQQQQAAQISSQNQQQQQHLQQQQQYQQLNSPVSLASSLVSSDSLATNQQSSPDVSSFEGQTPQNSSPQTTSSPQTPVASCGGSGGTNSLGASDDQTDNNQQPAQQQQQSGVENENSLSEKVLSPENDIKCTGSVLDKKSMFEKMEKQIINNNVVSQLPSTASSLTSSPAAVRTANTLESIYGKRNNEEIYKSAGLLERDADQYQDSIEELNNLIGELDSFQREHEQKSKLLSSHTSLTTTTTRNIDGNDCDEISINGGGVVNIINGVTNSSSSTDSIMNDEYLDYESNRYENSTNNHNGFENPSFIHLNHQDNIGFDPNYIRENTEIVVLRYNRENSSCDQNPTSTEIQTRSSKIPQSRSKNETPTLGGGSHLQRFSSFRSSSNYNYTISSQQSVTCNLSTTVTTTTQNNGGNNRRNINGMNGNNNEDEDYNFAKTNLQEIENIMINIDNNDQSVMDERIRAKPVISPRPASLSGCVSRITRRSSVNSMKPPPPVRRSSSVTPSPNLQTQKSPSVSQQNIMNSSSESLPPPPAYLLDTVTGAKQATSPQINVAETVKALTEIRHMPASPGVLRRAQNQLNQHQQQQQQQQLQQQQTLQYTNSFTSSPVTPIRNDLSISSMGTPQSSSSHSSSNDSSHNSSYSKTPTSSGIYAQPKISKMSSFRTSSPSSKQGGGILAQLNARLAPKSDKHHQQQQQQQQQQQIYQETRPNMYGPTSPPANDAVPPNRQFSTIQSPHHNQNYSEGKSNQIYSSNSSHSNQQQQQHHHHHQVPPSSYLHHPHPHHHQKQQHQQHHHHQQQQQQQHHYNQNIYVSTNPFITTPSPPTSSRTNYSPSSFGKDSGGVVVGGHSNATAATGSNNSSGQYSTTNVTNYTTPNYDKSGSVLTKTSAGFLENLNAKLAEQKRLSGKAFAVRNLINSKALSYCNNLQKNFPVEHVQQPDPRICHESLMDQIKRGAPLKRNQKINDRSAPKIH